MQVEHKEFTVSGADGTRLFCESIGRGDALLLCDGLLCDGHIWKYLIPYFKSRYRIIHWHYPGHGRSDDPPTTADLSPGRLAEDAMAVLADAKVEKAVVLGHSMGVQVALELAIRHPEMVRGLVLICGSPGRIVETFHESAVLDLALPFLDLAARFIPNQMSRVWRRMPTRALSRLVQRTNEVNHRLIDMEDLRPYLERINDVEFRVALRMLEAAGKHDASHDLSAIEAPTLVIAGDRDRFTPPGRSRYMSDRISNSRLLMSPGGTHSLPLEQPDLVNLRIKRFLQDQVGAG